jgi:triacylglycerol esterase/lipase EstA (alpha/beta hydrolase family)
MYIRFGRFFMTLLVKYGTRAFIIVCHYHSVRDYCWLNSRIDALITVGSLIYLNINESNHTFPNDHMV